MTEKKYLNEILNKKKSAQLTASVRLKKLESNPLMSSTGEASDLRQKIGSLQTEIGSLKKKLGYASSSSEEKNPLVVP